MIYGSTVLVSQHFLAELEFFLCEHLAGSFEQLHLYKKFKVTVSRLFNPLKIDLLQDREAQPRSS